MSHSCGASGLYGRSHGGGPHGEAAPRRGALNGGGPTSRRSQRRRPRGEATPRRAAGGECFIEQTSATLGPPLIVLHSSDTKHYRISRSQKIAPRNGDPSYRLDSCFLTALPYLPLERVILQRPLNLGNAEEVTLLSVGPICPPLNQSPDSLNQELSQEA